MILQIQTVFRIDQKSKITITTRQNNRGCYGKNVKPYNEKDLILFSKQIISHFTTMITMGPIQAQRGTWVAQ
jgi:hypothetical protein